MNRSVPVPEQFAGGCACGAIRYQCDSAPRRMVNCHCRDCQRAGGSGFSPSVIVEKRHFHLSRGRPRYYEIRSESGNLARRAFCKVCGSPLFAESSGHPELVAVRAGSLDDAAWFAASVDVWIESAQPWVEMSPDTEKYPGRRGKRVRGGAPSGESTPPGTGAPPDAATPPGTGTGPEIAPP